MTYLSHETLYGKKIGVTFVYDFALRKFRFRVLQPPKIGGGQRRLRSSQTSKVGAVVLQWVHIYLQYNLKRQCFFSE